MAIDFKKGTGFLKSTADKFGEAGKKAAIAAKDGVQNLSERAQDAAAQVKARQQEEMLKKFPPIFLTQYQNGEYSTPVMIQIVDNAEKQDVEEYQGAMGWTSHDKGVDILHLYSGAVADTELKFLTPPTPGALYCVHPHEEHCFISLDDYFIRIQRAQLAELEHIAYALGAVSYEAELMESTNEQQIFKANFNLKAGRIGTAAADRSQTKQTTGQSSSLASGSFSAGRKPVKPDLRWFAQDEGIRNLIQMRCSEHGSTMTSRTVELSSSTASALSNHTAASIQGAARSLGFKGDFSSKYEKECSQKLVFKVYF